MFFNSKTCYLYYISIYKSYYILKSVDFKTFDFSAIAIFFENFQIFHFMSFDWILIIKTQIIDLYVKILYNNSLFYIELLWI